MSHRQFDALKERLLRGGIAPRHVRRYLEELSHHFDDLVVEGIAAGHTPIEAEQAAAIRLGSDDTLAGIMLARPELRSVSAHLPWAVFGLGPIAIFAVLLVLGVLVEGGFLRLHLIMTADPGTVHPNAPAWLTSLAAG